ATGQLEVVTVFSAPNYCDAYKNMGAIVFYDQGVQEISQFTAVRHPYVLSGFQDGITWSFPFLAEKVLQFTLDLLNHGSSLKSCSSTQSSNNEDITDIFASIIGDTTDLLQKEDDLMKKVVLMRTERECIDEFADEESAVDCCNLEAKEMDDLNFGEAKDQDRVNEEAVSTPKLQSQQLTLNLSPSLANSAIIGVVKGNEDVVIKKSEGIEEIVNYKIADDQNGLIDQNRQNESNRQNEQNESNKQTSTIKQNKRKRSPWYCFWCAY
ncbi:PP2BA, partial [Enterospora canceri]